MKSSGNNFFKYIFILVVIGLICGAIYIIYNKNDSTDEENDIESSNEIENKDISIVENLKMGITNFDTMNPILTKNRKLYNDIKIK